MALYRALETKRPVDRRLFTDPYAIWFLDPAYRLVSRLAGFGPVERILYRIIQRRIPGAMASGLARTKYIDHLLERAVSGGAQQVMILGAGFDTRALRLPFLSSVEVIEIDHPDTTGKKRAVLEKATRVLPEAGGTVRYLSIDFDKQSLEGLFGRERIDLNQPTVFIWEGVTNYLQRAAVDAMFSLIGCAAPGSSIIFTYIHRRVLDEPAAFFGAERLLRDLEVIEERWTCGFDPAKMSGYLASFGMELMEDADAAEYRQRYIPERKVLLKGYEFYRVAMARVRDETTLSD